MRSIRKAEYKQAKKFGFIPRDGVSKSVKKRHYWLSDRDFYKYCEVMSKHTIESF